MWALQPHPCRWSTILMHLSIFPFCINFVRLEELIRNKDAWNWKLSSNKITRFVYSDWLHWLIAIIEQSLLALPQVREEHIRNCVSVMEDRVRIVPEKMLWLWSEDLISNWIYFFSRRNVVFLSLHFLFFVFVFVLFFVLHWSSGERKESRSSRATSGSSQGKFLHSIACKTLTRVYSLF